jgi:chromosomal replication initiation ATPase DnaA
METLPSPYAFAGVPQKRKVQSVQILYIVSEATGIPVSELMKENRKKIYVMIRFVYFYLARHHTRDSFAIIARLINRHHATAIHGSRLVATMLMLNDPHYHALVQKINSIINN